LNFSELSRESARGKLIEAQASIEGGRDIDHVYALEEVVPGRGSTKSHSPGVIFPDGNHYARHVRGSGASLKRLLNPRLFRGRTLSKRPVDGNDDHVLAIAAQVSDLKGGHSVDPLDSCFSHVSWTFSRRVKVNKVFSISLSVGFLSAEAPRFQGMRSVLPSAP